MSIRQILQDNPAVTTVAALLIAGTAITYALRSGKPPISGQVYFYDLGTGQLYPVPSTTVPPVTAASGKEGVQAVVMSCGDCGDPKQQFIAYLQKFSDEYRQAMASGGDIPPKVMMNGTLWRPEKGDAWVTAEGEQGRALRREVDKHCGDKAPKLCQP